MVQVTKEEELNKWQLQNFISGEDEPSPCYQEEQSGAKSRSVPVWLCHVRLGFYEVTGNLDTFKHVVL